MTDIVDSSVSQDQFIAKFASRVEVLIPKTATDSKDKSRPDSLDQAADPQQIPATWDELLDKPTAERPASDTVEALEKSGMETYDIPAFLRRQAD